MGVSTGLIYEFMEFRLDPAARTAQRNGVPLGLTPKVFDILLFLVQNPGRVLEKDELMRSLWPGSFVEDANLSQNIFILRRALGDDRNGRSLIQTIPRRGYQFVASVKETIAVHRDDSLATNPAAAELAEYWNKHSPFRSLQMFEPADAWLFFGRDEEIKELLVRLNHAPVLVMVGNSGCGKSSLIRAGLIAALRDGRFQEEEGEAARWRIAVCRPSESPFDYLAQMLPVQLASEVGLREQAQFIADCRSKLPLGGDALRNAISVLANANNPTGGSPRVLLVIDQFEEIFTLTTNPQIQTRYIDALLNVARVDGPVPVHLVLAVRGDFYRHCIEHAGLSRCLETNLYNVPRMSLEQMRETIDKRLELAGGHAESCLIDSLLEDVGAEPGDLALLEHVLGQLWEKRARGSTLTNKVYGDIGRVRGALGRHADEVYDSIGTEKQKQLVRTIFLQLVHLGEGAPDTRRRVQKSDVLCLCAGELEPLLARLISSRLVSTSLEGKETYIEVSHEALIREWPALHEWLAQSREGIKLERKLNQAAEEWENFGRDPGALLQGARLVQAGEWLEVHPNAPSRLKQFVSASIDARAEAQARELAQQRELLKQAEARAQTEKELSEQRASAAIQARRSASHLRWLSFGLSCCLLIGVFVTWFARRQHVLAQSGMFYQIVMLLFLVVSLVGVGVNLVARFPRLVRLALIISGCRRPEELEETGQGVRAAEAKRFTAISKGRLKAPQIKTTD
jgi:DNA-binding winged helix-turn-helix (wHTH) protein